MNNKFSMKNSKSFILIGFLSIGLTQSCQQVTYNDNPELNTYTDLQAGKPYTLNLKNKNTVRMNFTNLTKDSLIGNHKNKRISVAKKDLASSRNIQKNRLITTASVIGAAGVAALIISSSKADK